MNIKTILASAAVLALGLIGNTARAADAVDFETKVLPIFKERCFECHQKEYTDAKTGKVKKPKGKYRMDNPELLMKSGENGPNVVAGDADKSAVYKTTTLPDPDTDDAAMPPNGDRLTKEQQDIIKAWIAGGASFGAWKGAEK